MATLAELKNVDVETRLLGTMMLHNDVIATVGSQLRAEDFCSTTNRVLYSAIMELNRTGRAAEMVEVVEYLKSKGTLEKIGGIPLITRAVDAGGSPAYCSRYVEIIYGYSQRRQMMTLATELAAIAGDLDGDMDTAALRERIASLSLGVAGTTDSVTDDMSAFLEELGERSQRGLSGVMTGYSDVDKCTLGLRPGQMVILAARPAMGKSAFALNMAVNAAKAGKHVAIFSLEMPKNDLIARIVSSDTGIPLKRIQLAKGLDTTEWSKIIVATERISEENRLHIFAEHITTPADIVTRCATLKARSGLDLVIVDYLQLLTLGGRLSDNRVQEVSAISRKLKLLALDLGAPVLALSQLSRAVEGRNTKRPVLSDLRESGSIEQDADIVMMLYRESYYDGDADDKSAELTIVKNRNGELGTAHMQFFGQVTKFVPAAREGLGGTAVPKSQIPL